MSDSAGEKKFDLSQKRRDDLTKQGNIPRSHDVSTTTILAVTLGGTSLLGGKFSLAGTVLGALIIQTLTYTTYSIGVPPEATLVVKAAVVLVVSVIQSATARTVIMRQLKRVLPYALKKPLSEAAK